MAKKASPVRKAVKKGAKMQATESGQRLKSHPPSALVADPSSPIILAHNLAWMGQHTQAIKLTSLELSKDEHSLATRIGLLNQRVESQLAQGRFDLAAKDADTMMQLTEADQGELKVQTLNCKTLVQIHSGDVQDAIKTATLALDIGSTNAIRNKRLLAMSHFRMSEAYKIVSQFEAAVTEAQKAMEIFLAEGDLSGAGRASYIMAPSYNVLGFAQKSRHAAQTALELCQQANDQLGIGNALNGLSSTDPDLAERIHHYQQAIQAFEAVGHLERQSTSTGNLGFVYAALGLYTHARRLTRKAFEIDKAIGAKIGMAYWSENLFDTELRMGLIESAREHLNEMGRLAAEFGDPRLSASFNTNQGLMLLAEGKTQQAVQCFQDGVQTAREAEIGNENVHLSYLAIAHLKNNDPVAALAATTAATELHRSQDYKLPDSYSSHEIWWTHARALFANGKEVEARKALARAHEFLLEAIANVRDEGLRRNCLNKVKENRELLKFWISDNLNASGRRKLSKKKIFAHQYLESNTREPFKRLTDTALRMNALHTTSEMHTFIVEEATELSGGERVLFILEKNGVCEAAESILPRGENVQEVLNLIDPYLTQARLTRTVQLILPANDSDSTLSRIIAPLIAQNQIIGYIYADMDSLYGTFTEVDRDMLGMLANQAAVALDNVNWAQGLELKVQERTAELHARVDELAILNSVQAGLASQLDVNAIYELIGEQLRSLFDSQAISIISFDLKKGTRHYHYMLEQGQRHDIPDAAIPPLSQFLIQNKRPILINENFKERLASIGITSQTVPGTKPTKSLLRVPIMDGDEVRGVIGLDNIDRENAFNNADVRLLTTLASSMSVALEKARLYQQAQEARAAADAASAAKSAFLANMSHELRTPLNAIIGFTRIVRKKSEGVLPEKQIENLDKVLTSGEHLLGLINAVLDIAKIEAGRMEVHAANFNINALIEQCYNIALPSMKPAVKFDRRASEQLTLIHSDQEKIKQIMLHLLSNAAKFTHEGQVILAVEKVDASAEVPVPCFRISVSDTGIGISEEALGFVFGEFQQADNSTTRQYGGTGLGLTISRNLANLLGGELTATSELGKGSVFTLTLPIQFQPKKN